MHPAFSVIFFTVTSGAGYALMGLLALLNFLYLGMLIDKSTFFIISSISVILFTIGLVSSTFHLANPKNAWRAFMRFRTSWLAREGLLAIIFYPILFLYLYFVFIDYQIENFMFMQMYSCFILFLSLLIIYCTGMIYACLKTIPQWNTFWTPVNYITIGLFLGSLLLFLLLILNNYNVEQYKLHLIVIIITALTTKLIYYFNIRFQNIILVKQQMPRLNLKIQASGCLMWVIREEHF